MSAAPANPVHAHVAFLRVPRFESLPAAEQARHKESLEDAVLAAVAELAPSDRVVLDADDGLALVLFGDAEGALDVAEAVRKAHTGGPLQVGLNSGPLAVTARGPEARVVGDGLSAAAAAARFAEADRLLVTEDFARSLQAASPDRARELAGAGDFTDARIRIHKFYAPDPRLRAVRLRRIALYAVSGVIAILLIGVIGRDIYQPLFQSRPAIVKLDVRPRAEVFVDGVSQGRTPPLTEVQLTPGTRRISFRQAGYRPAEVTLEVKPGERRVVEKTLTPLPPAKPDPWRDFKKKFSG